jgi:hypothetical protein
MVRLTLARKLAAITLAVWKKGRKYDDGEPPEITSGLSVALATES